MLVVRPLSMLRRLCLFSSRSHFPGKMAGLGFPKRVRAFDGIVTFGLCPVLELSLAWVAFENPSAHDFSGRSLVGEALLGARVSPLRCFGCVLAHEFRVTPEVLADLRVKREGSCSAGAFLAFLRQVNGEPDQVLHGVWEVYAALCGLHVLSVLLVHVEAPQVLVRPVLHI